jgi:hypothetical protein
VILIGDHHQLPPVVQNQAFQKYSHLDQSLFARFVRLGTPYVELNAQVCSACFSGGGGKRVFCRVCLLGGGYWIARVCAHLPATATHPPLCVARAPQRLGASLLCHASRITPHSGTRAVHGPASPRCTTGATAACRTCPRSHR